MIDGLLSQEKLDALLKGSFNSIDELSDVDKDLLGEIGNISMGSASTALSSVVNRKVNITTPYVEVTSIDEIKSKFNTSFISVEVEYTEGLNGVNVLLLKTDDAAIIADLMMGGQGTKRGDELTELEVSAVSEAMNQMIWSSATSLSQMLNIPINISPQYTSIWRLGDTKLSNKIDDHEKVVRIAFKLTIEDLVDSEIMVLLNINTAKFIVDSLKGNTEGGVMDIPVVESENKVIEDSKVSVSSVNNGGGAVMSDVVNNRIENQTVQKAVFGQLTSTARNEVNNIDLILDVPLEVSVVLGRTKKSIKEILSLSVGSLVELDKLVEEPVEILVNGKKVALGEVVVIDENFGVRITSIISSDDRVKTLQG